MFAGLVSYNRGVRNVNRRIANEDNEQDYSRHKE